AFPGKYGKGSGCAAGTRHPEVRLAAFATAMDVCEPALASHGARVGANAEPVARRLGWDDDRLEALRLGAALHDVGKVNVRPEVLGKAGPLDEGELAEHRTHHLAGDVLAEIRTHPVEGTWLIAGVPSLSPALPYVLFHHERWDGDGYPTRRAGPAIPLDGRVLAVADAFDAMTSLRPYRRSLSAGEAATEIASCAGTQFDPEVVDAFLAALDAGEILLGEAAVAA